MHRRSRWIGWVAVGAVVAVAVSGCADEGETTPSVSAIQSSPEVADDTLVEEASAVAAEFVQLTDELFETQSVPERLTDITTTEIIANLEAELDSYVDLGYTFLPASELSNLEASSIERTSSSNAEIELVGCLDTSESRVTDSTGVDVPGGNASERTVTFEVTWQNETATVTATGFPDNDSGASPCSP